jgi:predicted DNA-binding transcriptional regulator YafY
MAQDYRLAHQLSLTSDTLQTIMIALNQLRTCSHSYFQEMATEAQTTITNALDTNLQQELKKHAQKYYFDYGLQGAPPAPSKDLQKIFFCLRENHSFSCRYKSPYKKTKQTTRRHFAPLIFILSSNIPYLIVEDLNDRQLKKLRISRIAQVKAEQTYTPIHDATQLPLSNMIGGFGGVSEVPENITIECKEIMATYFQERIIHPSQTITPCANGHYQITLCCAPSSELTRFLSSFSDQIISITPKYMHEDIAHIWQRGLASIEKEVA